MKQVILHLTILLLAPLPSLPAAEPPGLASSFPLGVYWPWERTEALAQCLAVAEAFAAVRTLVPLLKAAVPADPPFGRVSPPGWSGGLRNPQLKRTFTVVVNDDTDHEQTLTVSVPKPRDVRDLRTGMVLKCSPDNTIAVTLAPGDGTLLEEVP